MAESPEFNYKDIGPKVYELKVELTLTMGLSKPRTATFRFDDQKEGKLFIGMIKKAYAGSNATASINVYADGHYQPLLSGPIDGREGKSYELIVEF